MYNGRKWHSCRDDVLTRICAESGTQGGCECELAFLASLPRRFDAGRAPEEQLDVPLPAGLRARPEGEAGGRRRGQPFDREDLVPERPRHAAEHLAAAEVQGVDRGLAAVRVEARGVVPV